MAEAAAANPVIDPKAKTGNDGTNAAIKNAVAPRKNNRAAARDGTNRRCVTTQTTTGVSSNPTLAPAATAAFHNAPE